MNNNEQNDTSNIVKKLLDYCITQKRFEQDVGDYLRSKTAAPQLYSNDLRHQYASAVTAQQLGQFGAAALGNMYEIVWPGTQKDTAIDKYNNKVGRQYAKQYPNYTKQQYLDELFKNADSHYFLQSPKCRILSNAKAANVPLTLY